VSFRLLVPEDSTPVDYPCGYPVYRLGRADLKADQVTGEAVPSLIRPATSEAALAIVERVFTTRCGLSKPCPMRRISEYSSLSRDEFAALTSRETEPFGGHGRAKSNALHDRSYRSPPYGRTHLPAKRGYLIWREGLSS
jgi:hypothetical protein